MPSPLIGTALIVLASIWLILALPRSALALEPARNCRVKIAWSNPKEGTISGTVKIGDHTVDLEGTNPGNSEMQFTTKDEDGKVNTYKLTKTKQDPEIWTGKRNGEDKISFHR